MVAAPAIHVVHAAVPGRLRIRLDPARACQPGLSRALGSVTGISTVTVSSLTGSVLIHHDPSIPANRILEVVRRLTNHPERLPDPDVIAPAPAKSKPAADGDFAPHAMRWQDVVLRLETDAGKGLAVDEAQRRLEVHGRNRIGRTEARSQWAILAEQFTTLPIMLLGGSAVVSATTGGVADAAVTLAVAGTNALVGFATEGQAERTLRDFAAPSTHEAEVRRAGAVTPVSGDMIVPGDVLLLSPGQFIAADARVTDSRHLTVDEAPLTGESLPVMKSTEPLAEAGVPLADRLNMVFMGTTVSGGSGEAVVVATGDKTEIGRIQSLAGGAERPTTPVERELEVLGRRLVYLAGGVCAAMFGIGILRGYPRLVMLKNAIALAVAAVPEGLPTVATTTLALGLNEMKRKRALIRRLDAVESLGALQVVCFDKTGTLTQNSMMVEGVYVGLKRVSRPNGDGQVVVSRIEMLALLKTAVLCNEARAEPGANGTGTFTGSATEAALLSLAAELGVDVDALRARHPVLQTSYRDSMRRRMTTLHRNLEADSFLVAVKGSPDEVLSLCVSYHDGSAVVPLSEEMRQQILDLNAQMGTDGLRVLGFAMREFESEPNGDTETELVWLGLAGLADPIRDEAPDLMRRFHEAGIRTVMITGDQAATAVAVARDLKLVDGREPKVVTSAEIETASPEELATLVRDADVFARVSPAHKLKIVKALQRSGLVVGMTGDGINDGPALRAADIGIAMGANGSEIAKDMANVVLSDDHLSTLVDAIAQGRTIHANIRKALRFLLATNLSEILVTFGEALHGPNELETPLELLWINLVTDVLPALGLAMLPPDAGIMQQPPRPSNAALLSGRDFREIGVDGAIIGASTLAAHLYALGRYGPGPQTRAVTFSSIVLSQLAYAFTCRRDDGGHARAPALFGSSSLNLSVMAALGLHALPVFVPGVQRLLGISGLRTADLPVVALSALMPFAIRELTHPDRARGGNPRVNSIYGG